MPGCFFQYTDPSNTLSVRFLLLYMMLGSKILLQASLRQIFELFPLVSYTFSAILHTVR